MKSKWGKAKMKKERNKITILSKQYSTVQYSTVQYSTVQYSTVNKMKEKIESYEINSRSSKSRGGGKDIKNEE